MTTVIILWKWKSVNSVSNLRFRIASTGRTAARSQSCRLCSIDGTEMFAVDWLDATEPLTANGGQDQFWIATPLGSQLFRLRERQ
jgi:hypothetical protein